MGVTESPGTWSELPQSISEARLFGSLSDNYDSCCPPVFDPYTLVALLGGIALATYFLRIVIITTFIMMKRSFGYFDDPNWMTNILDELLEMNEEVNEEDLVQFSVV